MEKAVDYTFPFPKTNFVKSIWKHTNLERNVFCYCGTLLVAYIAIFHELQTMAPEDQLSICLQIFSTIVFLFYLCIALIMINQPEKMYSEEINTSSTRL